MIQRIPLLLTSLVSALVVAACTGEAGELPPPGELVSSQLQRNLSPEVSAADAEALVTGSTAFAVDAYRQLSQEGGNIFYSPFSISMAMAMTYAGARTVTAEQMASALHYTLPQEQLHPAINWLDLELSRRGQGAAGADGQGFRLNMANAVFGQDGYGFLPEYLDLLAVNYGAGLALLDFETDPEAARLAINNWVADSTEDRIPDLFPRGTIRSDTRLVLTNAVYFNAAWKQPFEPERTVDGTFHAAGGDVIVPMMSGENDSLRYTSGDGYQALALPYDGDELDMVMIMPDEGRFEDIEAGLDAAFLTNIFDSLAPGQYGMLTMPKFEFRFKAELIEQFQELGLTSAFNGQADFSGMDGTRNLMITAIVHEAFVKVNEAGTEASAATGVAVGETAVPPGITVDRPFLFLIRDIETGAVLFLGRMLDPTAE